MEVRMFNARKYIDNRILAVREERGEVLAWIACGAGNVEDLIDRDNDLVIELAQLVVDRTLLRSEHAGDIRNRYYVKEVTQCRSEMS